MCSNAICSKAGQRSHVACMGSAMQEKKRFLSPSQIEDIQERADNKECEEPFTRFEQHSIYK